MKSYLSLYKEDLCIADKIELGNTVWKRFRGLMGCKSLSADQGFYLRPCRSVHTFHMRFPIDVLFLSRENIVVDIEHEMAPWRIRASARKADSTLELVAGTAKSSGIVIGDRLELAAAPQRIRSKQQEIASGINSSCAENNR